MALKTTRLFQIAGLAIGGAVALTACAGGSATAGPTESESTASGESITVWLDE